MKVLVIGFPKTGTKSLTAALRHLGYNVFDHEEQFQYNGKQWVDIMTKGGTKEDFYVMLKDVDACSDMPACLFWEEILEAFPDVKMVFMKRANDEEWWRSWKKQVESFNSSYLLIFMNMFSPTMVLYRRFEDATNRAMFCGKRSHYFQMFGGNTPTLAKKRYRDHNASVELRAPKENLLNFDLKDGWKPLCEFLGKPMPDASFPHKNKGASLLEERKKSGAFFAQLFREAVIGFTVTVVLIGVLCYSVFDFL